jgi:DNA-binding transcriptional LysR family regulator
MITSKIDLNLFLVFDAIYTQQSLTRAAGVLHVSQPAVSSSLAKLRSIFDDPLFVRSASGMNPTPLARQLIGTVRDSLKNLDSCVAARIGFDPANSTRTFRIHATENAELILLPKLLSLLAIQAPEINLEVIFMDRREVAFALASGKLDLAIDAPLLSHPEMISQPLYADDYSCVMRKGHALSRGELNLSKFIACHHIHVSSRLTGSGYIDLALRSIGEKRRIALRLQHYAALPALLNHSDFIAAIPTTIAKHWQVERRLLPFAAAKLELHLGHHKSVSHDPALIWLRGLLSQLNTTA